MEKCKREEFKRDRIMNEIFRKFAGYASEAVGSPWAFATAVLTVICWLLIGPAFGFSDSWQLTFNTGVTITTFLMVFIIQNTQNRNDTVVQLKLNELLRGSAGPRTHFVELDDMSDEELQHLKSEFQKLKEQIINARISEQGTPHIK
jgi:low affinity Fe/Cu permease